MVGEIFTILAVIFGAIAFSLMGKTKKDKNGIKNNFIVEWEV